MKAVLNWNWFTNVWYIDMYEVCTQNRKTNNKSFVLSLTCLFPFDWKIDLVPFFHWFHQSQNHTFHQNVNIENSYFTDFPFHEKKGKNSGVNKKTLHFGAKKF